MPRQLGLPPPPLSRLREVKRKLDGVLKSFDLECWCWDPVGGVAVGRWLAPDGNQFGIQPGSFSWGVWGSGVFGEVGAGAYRIHSSDGRLQRYRFDVLGGVHWNATDEPGFVGVLTFDDLLLDAFVHPEVTADRDNTTTFEDEDELQEAQAAGKLSTAQLAIVEVARDALKYNSGSLTQAVDLAIETAIQTRRDEL